MLTEQEKGIVKETVPVLQERGTEITSYFYNRMFQQHPELKNMFNQTNQQKDSIYCFSSKCISSCS